MAIVLSSASGESMSVAWRSVSSIVVWIVGAKVTRLVVVTTAGMSFSGKHSFGTSPGELMELISAGV